MQISFPRAGKRNGAWMTSFTNRNTLRIMIYNDRPHISIVCNFTKPTKSKPSLLTFNEVTTLFHEFGHALHGMLANTTYPKFIRNKCVLGFCRITKSST